MKMAARENVGFGYVEELDNDELIRLATTQSGAASIIENLPQKYDTTLGRMFEKGHELSIGQWQKMALARAFMRHAPVVVLDEPTSSIDAESEAEIFGQLQQIAAGATTLLIAHRFSTVRMADRIIVIKVSYNLRVSDEVKIHEKLLKQAHLRNVHVAPGTIRVASTFAVLSRLEASKKEGMSLMKKLKLYDGEEVEEFSQRDVKELQDECLREGMDGIQEHQGTVRDQLPPGSGRAVGRGQPAAEAPGRAEHGRRHGDRRRWRHPAGSPDGVLREIGAVECFVPLS